MFDVLRCVSSLMDVYFGGVSVSAVVIFCTWRRFNFSEMTLDCFSGELGLFRLTWGLASKLR